MDIKAWLYAGLRTGAQALWGGLAAYLAQKGIVLPDILQGWFVDILIVGGVIGAAAAGIRWLESRVGDELWKRAARSLARLLMLGLSKQPVYAPNDDRAVSTSVTYANGTTVPTLKE